MTESLSDLRSWQIFGELMRCGSMSRAATACGCDVSQVSRRIAALEKRVGYPLFERSTRSTLPTGEARELYERLYPVLSDIDRRIEAVTASVGMRRNRRLVRIQTVSGLLPFLVRTIGSFRMAHEEYDFDVRILSAPPADETLDADIGIWADARQSAFLEYRDLGAVPSRLCASPAFSANDRRSRPGSASGLQQLGLPVHAHGQRYAHPAQAAPEHDDQVRQCRRSP